MKIILPLIAAAALSACGSSTPAENASTGAAATDPVAMNGSDMNAMAGNDMAMAPAGGAGAVTVTINGVSPNGGPVLVALQDSAGFAKAAGAYTSRADPTGATVTATFQGVAPGSYAAAAVQDTNNDGTLTLEATGPSEPWGFSGTPQTGAPTFAPASFQVAETGGVATVTLSGGAAAAR